MTPTSNNSHKKVLFLCTGNSCRSQMAEAIINSQFSDEWQAYSAGTKPAGYVHPFALQVLQEIGLEHQGSSKHTDQLRGTNFDIVVTVCDSAAEECPLWLGPEIRVHHSFPDPAKATGSQDEILNAFRNVRDRIAVEIPQLIQNVQLNKS